MFKVLINDVFKKHLLRQPRDYRQRVREKLEFLENGIWDGGLRVKKLKGASPRCVFEGRLDAGNRILFSLGRETGRDGAVHAVAYVWGVASHDKVDRKSRSALPGDVPFLGFRPLSEVKVDSPELERMDASVFTQEAIAERVDDDAASQRWHPVAEPEWDRIRRYAADAFELFLHLTPEQEMILESPLPLLIAGTAGSGKTTLCVYGLLRSGLRASRRLFVTYNRHLRNYAEQLYYALLNGRDDEVSPVSPDFRTFRDLCLEIAAARGKTFAPQTEVDLHRFGKLAAAHPLAPRLDVVLVWEEIRSILKGALPPVNPETLSRGLRDLREKRLDASGLRSLQDQFLAFACMESGRPLEKAVRKHLDTDLEAFARNLARHAAARPERVIPVLEAALDLIHRQRELTRKRHLSFVEYELLGRKKAPNFPASRKSVYAVFEWYQAKLAENGWWDEADLAREACIFATAMDGHRWDAVVCDEVQDLTDVQQGLLFGLVRDPLKLLFAGDARQIVNPSGFRWEDLKRHFHERNLPVPPLRSLSLNFRSSGSVVELGNALLALQESLLGTSSELTREAWKYKGRPPAVVRGLPEADFLPLVRAAGAKRTLLVRTEEERTRLSRELGTELVFTITEAKGLEFDTVVLWKFAAAPAARDVWATILGLADRPAHDAWVRHEINLLYVAVTRARADLIVYDGPEPSAVWAHPDLAERVFETGDAVYVEKLWNTLSSPEEWVAQGRYFLEREHYRAAMECFRNGGDERALAGASALCFEKEGRWAEAAGCFEAVGETSRAAALYQRAGEFAKALPLWEAIGDSSNIQACRMEVYRRDGNHLGLAGIHLDRREYREAADSFLRAREHARAAVLYEKQCADPRRAAPCYEAAGLPKKAAAAWTRGGELDRAGELYERLGDFARAERCWKKGRCTDRLLKFYRQRKCKEKLLELYEREGMLDQALKLLQADSDPSRLREEAETLMGRRKFRPALIRFQAAKDVLGEARCRLAMKEYAEAALLFGRGGDPRSAGQAWARKGDFSMAVEAFLACPESDSEAAKELVKSIEALSSDKAKPLRAIGGGLLSRREFGKAARFFAACGDPLNEGCCRTLDGNDAAALDCWGRLRSSHAMAEVAKFAQRENRIRVGGRFFLGLDHGTDPWRSLILNDAFIEETIVLMNRYFGEHPDPVQRRRWYRELSMSDDFGYHWQKILPALERVGEYGVAAAYMNRVRITGYGLGSRETRKKLQEEIPSLVKEQQLEPLALRLQFLKEWRRLNDVVGRIPLQWETFALFGGSERHGEALAFCREQGADWAMEDFFYVCSDFRGLGALEQSRGNPMKAMDWFEKGGDFGAAARIQEQLKMNQTAGENYFKAGEYAKAREMLEGETKKSCRTRVAKACEAMGDYAAALEIWRELKSEKNAQRCRMKLQKTLF
ncbi:MAG: ATP-binding domain-containing protein [Acidobacteria bacterium]|nr:ATP-binding domain-containing protein [Acidobacteriota bacterium]